jgi:acyl-CoA thioesterase-1
MLNHFLYHLASGQAWFSCGMVILAVVGLDLGGAFDRYKRLGRAAWVLLLLAMMLAGISATPVSWILAVPLLICCVGYLLFGFSQRKGRRRLVLGTGTVITTSLALATESPFHWAGPPKGEPCHRLYVVADSLAAGLGREKTTWPKLLASRTGIEVCDLSFAGANAHSALRGLAQALESDKDGGAWVLISIGGNDMLGRTSADNFEKDLDQLLEAARGNAATPRTVLMQELPLIPGAWAFGAIQRRLAAKHGVLLIPKRLLAGVVLTDENVVDGLHLSSAGHERMADLLVKWLSR